MSSEMQWDGCTGSTVIAVLASEVNSGRRLRSMSIPTFVIPRTRMNLGDRSFAAAGPRLWNSLPGHLHQSETLAIFKRPLKTFFFKIRLWRLVTS